jgi:hypothetical protein
MTHDPIRLTSGLLASSSQRWARIGFAEDRYEDIATPPTRGLLLRRRDWARGGAARQGRSDGLLVELSGPHIRQHDLAYCVLLCVCAEGTGEGERLIQSDEGGERLFGRLPLQHCSETFGIKESTVDRSRRDRLCQIAQLVLFEPLTRIVSTEQFSGQQIVEFDDEIGRIGVIGPSRTRRALGVVVNVHVVLPVLAHLEETLRSWAYEVMCYRQIQARIRS